MKHTPVKHSEVPAAPKPHGRRQPWADLTTALRDAPGTWFQLTDLGYQPRMVQVTASRIRNGGLKAFTPKGAFEARHDWKDIWVRYVGPEELAE